MPGRRAVPFVVAVPRKAKRGKKREKGGEEGWLEATTYRGRGQRGEGRRKGRKTGRRRGDWPFIFVVPPGSAACSRKGGQNSGDPLWPAFIATTPKGAFIFISIMGHRDVYAPRSALSLRSFIIINSTTGPPPPPPLHQDFRRFLPPPSPPPPPLPLFTILFIVSQPLAKELELENVVADLFAPFSPLVYEVGRSIRNANKRIFKDFNRAFATYVCTIWM